MDRGLGRVLAGLLADSDVQGVGPGKNGGELTVSEVAYALVRFGEANGADERVETVGKGALIGGGVGRGGSELAVGLECAADEGVIDAAPGKGVVYVVDEGLPDGLHWVGVSLGRAVCGFSYVFDRNF